MIAKKLYNEISKQFLPVEHLLIFFFRRIIFVFVYSLALILVMILGRDSGIPETVQVISAIAGALIPFIFDTIFADHHLTQRNANNLAMKDKLWHILKAKRFENNIVVEINNLNWNVNSLKPQVVSQSHIC